MSDAKRDEYIRVLVERAPPLTDEQITKLRALLPPVLTPEEDARMRAIRGGAVL